MDTELTIQTPGRSIRLAQPSDLSDIMQVVEAAKGIMRASGNMKQWQGGYPSEQVLLADMQCGGGHVIIDQGRTVGYFSFLPSPDPTYGTIYEGEWLDDTLPYHVVHRIASYPDVHNVLRDLLAFCTAREPNLRIDTHRDNTIMQHNLIKLGFTYCGIIYLASGDERLAYQRVSG